MAAYKQAGNAEKTKSIFDLWRLKEQKTFKERFLIYQNNEQWMRPPN